MKKLTIIQKEYINTVTEISAKSCKKYFDTCDTLLKKSSFISGIWVGLIAVGFDYDSVYDDEILEIWDKAE